jgi:hypothetical protein
MPEEATQAPAVDWVAKLAAEGWPVIRGGAPEEAETPPPAAGTPPETPVTPETGAPPESPSDSPEIDWKQRYEDLRPEADRRASILADIEGRNGPERQAAALSERARIELEAADEAEEEDDDDFDLPPDPNERIDQLERERQDERQQREDAEFDQLEEKYLESTVEALEAQAGLKLSDEAYDFVVNKALANRDPHDGKPDVEGSFKAWKAEVEAAGQSWVKSKDAVIPPLGTEGDKKLDPSILRDKDKRQNLGVEVFEAAERAKQTQ